MANSVDPYEMAHLDLHCLHGVCFRLKGLIQYFQEIRNEFDAEPFQKGSEKLQLSAAVAAGRAVMEIYDVPALARYIFP